jgi:hypothetical protein
MLTGSHHINVRNAGVLVDLYDDALAGAARRWQLPLPNKNCSKPKIQRFSKKTIRRPSCLEQLR